MLALLVPVAGAAPTAAAGGCADGPFTPALGQYLAQRFAGHAITAAVYDARDGCEYLLHPELRITTASVVKVEIMAGVLLRAQREGRALSAWERDRIAPMITRSENPPASQLWSSLGGRAAMGELDRTFGLVETTPVGPVWGLTSTSARDQTTLLRQVVMGSPGPLAPAYRAEARRYMTEVVPEQRWGVTAGVPGGWVVPQKNGFADSQCCRWRINSVGVVDDPAGGAYAVAILSDGWTDQASGITAAEVVSRAVSASLARVPYGPFPSTSAFVAQQHRDLLGREPDVPSLLLWTAAVGTDAARAGTTIQSLARSSEGDERDSLARLYLTAFARIPDQPGFGYWDRVLHDGTATLFGAADSFARSPELGGGGRDDGGFVDLVYQRVFHRQPDSDGRAYWSAQLAHGVPRGTVLLALSDAAESRATNRVGVDTVLAYWAMLRRVPDADEYAGWLQRRAALSDIAAVVFGSPEYAARFA